MVTDTYKMNISTTTTACHFEKWGQDIDTSVRSCSVSEKDRSIRIGVVLSSGGGRGVYAHTGFLSALEELGIEITVISGCSAGALVGGVYASGTSLDQWSESIANVKNSRVLDP